MTTVEKLYQAYKTNQPLPLGQVEATTKEEAYAIQDGVLALKEADGQTLKGYKISLTSQKTQDLFNSDSPLYGGMTDVTVKHTYSLKDYNQPLLELELVFLIEDELLPTDSLEELMAKCKVAPGLEVPDARYQDWFPKASLYEVIADGAVNGGVAYGEAKKVSLEDIADVAGQLFFNDELVTEGRSTEVLGHPVHSLKWLVDTLAEHGKTLPAGMFVSSGTFVMPVKLEVGTYKAVYDNLGSVELVVTE
ncbi:2-keto-4-pentenoate hydratase [Streptococcus sp. sy018]|uniref:2-keto-4-pentenoate hydratase n=1 Tax=Streptococcus sp. sy018 TaxID=2600147 RepID=UPI0011B7D163|nr:hydratase [Streptococcus sp. sy018]TWS95337.1 hydratase [Streptococcus sp. sy018]